MDAKEIGQKIKQSSLSEKRKSQAMCYVFRQLLPSISFTDMNIWLTKNGLGILTMFQFDSIKPTKYPPTYLIGIFMPEKIAMANPGRFVYQKEIAVYFRMLIKQAKSKNKMLGLAFMTKDENNSASKQFNKQWTAWQNAKGKVQKDALWKSIAALSHMDGITFSQQFRYKTKTELTQKKIAAMNKFLMEKGLIHLNRNTVDGKRKITQVMFAETRITKIADKLAEEQRESSGWLLSQYLAIFGEARKDMFNLTGAI